MITFEWESSGKEGGEWVVWREKDIIGVICLFDKLYFDPEIDAEKFTVEELEAIASKMKEIVKKL